jgi:hypothetical protein
MIAVKAGRVTDNLGLLRLMIDLLTWRRVCLPVLLRHRGIPADLNSQVQPLAADVDGCNHCFMQPTSWSLTTPYAVRPALPQDTLYTAPAACI